MPRYKLRYLLAPFLALAAFILAACTGTDDKSNQDGGSVRVLVVSPLTAEEVAAVSRSSDPVIKQLLAAGYQPRNQIEPGGTEDKWAIELLCDSQAGTPCVNGPSKMELKLTDRVKPNRVKVATKEPIYMAGNQPKPRYFACATPHNGFKSTTLWKLPAIAANQTDGMHQFKIDGIKYKCFVSTYKPRSRSAEPTPAPTTIHI